MLCLPKDVIVGGTGAADSRITILTVRHLDLARTLPPVILESALALAKSHLATSFRRSGAPTRVVVVAAGYALSGRLQRGLAYTVGLIART